MKVSEMSKGDRVKFKYQGDTYYGKVTGRINRGARIRSVDGQMFTTLSTDEKYSKVVATKQIRPAKFGVFVFDTCLDTSLYSDRQAADFWYRYCTSAGWAHGAERVHSIADLKYFLRRKIKENVLLFSGHGSQRKGFRLTNGEILDKKVDLSISRANSQKVIIFSACLMGANRALCEHLGNELKARAVIAYSKMIPDDLCFIAEPLLLQFLSTRIKPEEAVEKTNDALKELTPLVQKRSRAFPLRCFNI